MKGILGRMQKPRRVQVRVRGHGSGLGDGLYRRLRSLVGSLGLRSTGHSGRRLIIDVGIWPRWLTGNEPMATISLYPNDGIIVNWVRVMRQRASRMGQESIKPQAK